MAKEAEVHYVVLRLRIALRSLKIWFSRCRHIMFFTFSSNQWNFFEMIKVLTYLPRCKNFIGEKKTCSTVPVPGRNIFKKKCKKKSVFYLSTFLKFFYVTYISTCAIFTQLPIYLRLETQLNCLSGLIHLFFIRI